MKRPAQGRVSSSVGGRQSTLRRTAAAIVASTACAVVVGVVLEAGATSVLRTAAQAVPTPTPTDLRCITQGANGQCTFPAPALGTPPVQVQSPVPCPAPANGPVCTTYTNPRGSGQPPPALPPQHNVAATCAQQPAPASPNAWTTYGAPQLIDWHAVTSIAPQAPGQEGSPGGAAYDDEFPLPFKVVVDRFQPCIAYRIGGPGWSQLQRSRDGGTTWQVVLDGTRVAQGSTPPRFRRIVVAGADAEHEMVYALEQANGDALVSSADRGTTWTLASGSASAAVNLIGEFPYAIATGQDPRVVYAATLQCFGAREHPQFCQSEQLDRGQDTGPAAGGNVGPMRLYWSHDGGATWSVLAGDSTTGLPSCNLQWLDLTADPDRDGHLWIDYLALPDPLYNPCPSSPTGRPQALEAAWNGSDYATATSKAVCNTPGGLAVTRAPSGAQRIVCHGIEGYSDDDGTTWTLIDTPVEGVDGASNDTRNYASAPGHALVKLSMVAFGAYDRGSTVEPRMLVYRAASSGGKYDVELGAALPSFGSDAERTLFDWPPYDPVIPPLHSDLLADEDSGEHVADYEVDGAGNVYVNIGIACYNAACAPDAAARAGRRQDATQAHWALWQTMRYTVPPAGTLPALLNPYSASDQQAGTTPHTSTSCSSQVQNSCYLVPLHQCTITGDTASDANGNLAFTGSDLLYTRTGERGPAPFTAVVHRLDPGACAGQSQAGDAGLITVHFPPDDYARARAATQLDYAFSGPWLAQPALPADRPLIDTITYDAGHDRIYFTLQPENVPDPYQSKSNGVAAMENQLSLWSADLHSRDGTPAPSLVASLVSLDAGYCPDDNGTSHTGAASQVLAFDPIGDNTAQHGHGDGVIWACMPGRPAELDTAGAQIDEPCYGSFEMLGVADTGLHVDSWAMEDLSRRAAHHRAFLHLNGPGGAGLEIFDLDSCSEIRHYTPNPQQPPAYGSSTLACDAVTYGSNVRVGNSAEAAGLESQEGVPAFTGTLRGAVIWQRTGNTLVAGLIPDNGDAPSGDAETCRMPVSLAYTGPTVVQPGLVTITGRLSIDGTGAPAVGQPVIVEVDGHPVDGSPRTTGSDGTFTVAAPLGAGQHTVHLVYVPSSTNLAFYSAESYATLGPAPVLPGSQQPNGPVDNGRPSGTGIAITSTALQPPATVDLGTPPVAAQGGPGSQVAQSQGQAAAAEEREEERQLAYAYEFPDEGDAGAPADAGAPPRDEAMPMTALSARNGGAVLIGPALSGMTVATTLALVVALRWSASRQRRREPAWRREGRR